MSFNVNNTEFAAWWLNCTFGIVSSTFGSFFSLTVPRVLHQVFSLNLKKRITTSKCLSLTKISLFSSDEVLQLIMHLKKRAE